MNYSQVGAGLRGGRVKAEVEKGSGSKRGLCSGPVALFLIRRRAGVGSGTRESSEGTQARV